MNEYSLAKVQMFNITNILKYICVLTPVLGSFGLKMVFYESSS